MHCPTCIIAVLMSERQDPDLEFCPQCRVIKQDRDELYKRNNRKEPESQKNNPKGQQVPE